MINIYFNYNYIFMIFREKTDFTININKHILTYTNIKILNFIVIYIYFDYLFLDQGVGTIILVHRFIKLNGKK